MARNLYDLGDAPSRSDAWLNEQQEGRRGIVPRGAVLVALLLGGIALLLLREMLPDPTAPKTVTPTTVIDSFTACNDPAGVACVLSSDRYAHHGRSYRIGDIDVPSLASPKCRQEADLARQGRMTLLTLMNGGAFEARADPTDRAARILTRDGVSLGSLLIIKGYARTPAGAPTDWCRSPAS